MFCAGSARAFIPSPIVQGAFSAKAAPAHAASTSSTVMMAKSTALPFMDSPPALDGSAVGDFGFDPLGLTENINIPYGRCSLDCCLLCVKQGDPWPPSYCIRSSIEFAHLCVCLDTSFDLPCLSTHVHVVECRSAYTVHVSRCEWNCRGYSLLPWMGLNRKLFAQGSSEKQQ